MVNFNYQLKTEGKSSDVILIRLSTALFIPQSQLPGDRPAVAFVYIQQHKMKVVATCINASSSRCIGNNTAFVFTIFSIK